MIALKHDEILAKMECANAYFMQKWPDTTKTTITDRERPSNIWTRATYYEGLLALYRINHDAALYAYALEWATFHNWDMRDGLSTRNPDNQCCGQVYLEMYDIDPQEERLTNITACINNVLNDTRGR